MKNGQMHISTYMKLLNKTSVFWIGIIVMLVLIILSIFAGNSSVSSQEIINSIIHPKDSLDSVNTIIYNIRLPRIVAASICGAALSLSGLIAQEALSNNLASPSVMGINNGAGLFVLFSSILFPGMIFVRPLMAFVGSMVSACIVFVITRYAGSAKSTFILSGVAVSALMSAGINLIITIEPDSVYDCSYKIYSAQFSNCSINYTTYAFADKLSITYNNKEYSLSCIDGGMDVHIKNLSHKYKSLKNGEELHVYVTEDIPLMAKDRSEIVLQKGSFFFFSISD